jgi:hypothetical protein
LIFHFIDPNQSVALTTAAADVVAIPWMIDEPEVAADPPSPQPTKPSKVKKIKTSDLFI